MNPEITLIIPFYNEEGNIPRLINELNLFITKERGEKFEIIFIDDGSSDNSAGLIASGNFVAPVRLIKFSKNYGPHAALRAAVTIASGKFITFNYADLQDPLDLVDRMYEKCCEGSEIVWGVRNSIKSGFFEQAFSKGYAKLLQIFVNPDFPKNGFDVVMFNSKVKDELNKNIESNSSIFVQILNLGFKQNFIKYDKKEREFGKSKWTFSKKFKLFIDTFVAFSYAPIRFVTVMGLILFLFGFFWTVYIVFRELLYHDLSPGWPTLISILMICFGVTNISLGIIAEYLWRTLDASRKRPVFIIDQTIDLKSQDSKNLN